MLTLYSRRQKEARSVGKEGKMGGRGEEGRKEEGERKEGSKEGRREGGKSRTLSAGQALDLNCQVGQ